MIKLILRILLGTFAVLVTAKFLPQAITVQGFYAALIVSLIIGIMGVTVRPLLTLITLPVTLLTFGLFSFIIDGFILYFIGTFVEGFAVASFWWAVVAAFTIGVIKMIGNKVLKIL